MVTSASPLELRGFGALTAPRADEGIERLKEVGASVAVLDLLMPGRNGIETLQEMKEINLRAKVTMLTGHGTRDTAIDGLGIGAHGYLLKPSETDDLVAKILRACA